MEELDQPNSCIPYTYVDKEGSTRPEDINLAPTNDIIRKFFNSAISALIKFTVPPTQSAFLYLANYYT